MRKSKVMLGLLNNKIGFFSIISILLFLNCKKIGNKETENFQDKINDTLLFKNWIKDTIPKLELSETSFKLYQDSTLLEIYKTYKTILNEEAIKHNPDLLLAFELLKENNDLNLDDVMIDYEVIHSYEVSQVGKKYDYNLEIKKFQASNKDKIFLYNYVKGNLIDKKQIK